MDRSCKSPLAGELLTIGDLASAMHCNVEAQRVEVRQPARTHTTIRKGAARGDEGKRRFASYSIAQVPNQAVFKSIGSAYEHQETKKTFAGLIVGAALSWAAPVFADAASDWNEIAVIATSAGRAGAIGQTDMALTQVAMHDALQAYERRFEPYYAQVKPVPGGSKAAAGVAAVHGVLVGFYPAQAASLDATYAIYLANHGLTGDPGLAVGEEVAAKILTLRRLDPNPLPPPNVGENVPGKWRPTQNHLGLPPLPPPAPFAFPWMGDFHPFVLTGPARFRPAPPPELTSDRYTTDYNEVKAKGSLTGSTRTHEQTDIAYFWLDNFGAQHNRALRELAAIHIPKIGDRARLYALANLAGADALITAWDSKKHYNVWRPLTAIQEGESDDNPNTAGDPAWLSFTNNPPYPDYTSGANSITGAMMRTLSLYFGTDNMRIRVTTGNPLAIKKSRTYNRFSAVAAQVVSVRVWQGIHFRFADTEARKSAEKVAEYVHDHALLPIVK